MVPCPTAKFFAASYDLLCCPRCAPKYASCEEMSTSSHPWEHGRATSAINFVYPVLHPERWMCDCVFYSQGLVHHHNRASICSSGTNDQWVTFHWSRRFVYFCTPFCVLIVCFSWPSIAAKSCPRLCGSFYWQSSGFRHRPLLFRRCPMESVGIACGRDAFQRRWRELKHSQSLL